MNLWFIEHYYRMVKNILILIIFFYILALLQTSFFIHFSVFLKSWANWALNLIFISVILINLFEAGKSYFGYISSLIGGFFLDIFSNSFIEINFFGFYIIILTLITLFIKLILKRYVRPVIRLGGQGWNLRTPILWKKSLKIKE